MNLRIILSLGSLPILACIFFIVFISVPITSPAQSQNAERIPVTFPVLFTRNDGQWDSSVRYAVLHQASRVSLRGDGIDISFPDSRPRRMPEQETVGIARNREYMRFVQSGPSMEVVGGERTESLMHFYYGLSREGATENVATFKQVVYENVWPGCDVVYVSEGDKLIQRTILRPGADPADVKFEVTPGTAEDYRRTRVLGDSPRSGTDPVVLQQGNVVSFSFLPGILHDAIVLETEFNTFFGDPHGQTSLACDVMPGGSVLLYGYGLVSYDAKPGFIPPQDSTCAFNSIQENFFAEFSCDGRSLRFCTNLIGHARADGLIRNTIQIFVDDTSGYFLQTAQMDDDKSLSEHPTCALPLRPPLIDGRPGSGEKSTWLGKLTRDGHLTISTYISGILSTRVLRARDGGVLLSGFQQNGVVPQPFLHYTKQPLDESGGMLVKLNARCDSVLIGVNLDFLGDSLHVVSMDELSDGSVVIAGVTNRAPVTRNAWQPQHAGMIDLYIARLTPGMDSVLWATFLGGESDEYLAGAGKWYCRWGGGPTLHRSWRILDGAFGASTNHCLAVDADDGIWVTGTTLSSSMREVPGNAPRNTRGAMDMLLARFDRDGQPTMVKTFGGLTESACGGDEWALNLEILPCGNCLVTGLSRTVDFQEVGGMPWDRRVQGVNRCDVNILASFDRDGNMLFSSWYPEFVVLSQRYDPSGHLVGAPPAFHHQFATTSSEWDYRDDWAFMRTYNALQPALASPGPSPYDAILTRQYLPLCGEDAISCAFTVPDTIRRDSTRGYLSDSFIPLDVTITNPDPTRAVFDLQAELRLPPGFVLVPDTMPLLLYAAPMLAPGDTAYAQWVLQVRPDLIADTLLPITVVTHYRWADHLDNCLQSHGGCRAEIVYARRDSKRMELSCDLDAPMLLMIDATGERYVSDTIPVTLTLRNLGEEAVLPGEVALQVRVDGEPGTAGVSLLPEGDHIHYLDRLQPNAEVQSQWIAHVDRRGFDREVTFEVVVRDEIGQLPVACLATVHVPGIPALRCSLSAPDALYPVSDMGFEDFAMELQLENVVDTLVRRVEAEVDLSQAPHLRLSSGETARHYLGPTAASAIRTSLWQLAVDPAPQDSSTETITVWYWYQEDSTRRSCEIRIQLIPVIQSSVCSITAPAVLNVDDSLLLPSPFTLDYRLRNTGNETLEVGRYVLSLAPPEGLLAHDPLSVAGGTLAPGTEANRTWRVQAKALQSARSAVLTVEARDLQDSVLSTCMHMLNIPAIDGLRCTLTAEDTVRFVRTPPGYQPSPLNLRLDLRNVLDEIHTNIEAIINLTQSPRLTLDPSETASKTIAVMESHSTANLTWLLIPQPASTAEDQEIIVRYRSDEQAAWKQCSVIIHIEAWPEEPGITCETGGHDSLFADWYEERFIPDPLHVSYTVTNTGTVTLTGCEASIILPPEFSLAGSDGTQSFTSPEYANQPGGPVPDGTLLPGASCSRWWKITPAKNIADIDPRLATWIWKSNEQGTESGCTHIVYIIPDNPPGLVLTPLHLYFEAERGGALPVEQQVQLWTGGGLAMPWTAQPSEWWLDAQPTSGSQSTQISVQPNSTMLEVGAHNADLLFAATPTDRHVTITYVIRKSTGIESPATPGVLTLDAWPQPVAAGARLYVRIGGEAGGSCRLTLHDLLGRQRLTRYAETASPVVIDLGALQLPTGVYLLRAIAEDGAQATRMISVTGGR
ncbi:T9SS type A sorting domain-containing protein [bacterium]|nr:T9SS type A sorting domain-containing protein [bacterium]